jgi:hypothetical protein
LDLEPLVRSKNANVRSIGNVAEWCSRSDVVRNLNHLFQRGCLFSSTRNAKKTKKKEEIKLFGLIDTNWRGEKLGCSSSGAIW